MVELIRAVAKLPPTDKCDCARGTSMDDRRGGAGSSSSKRVRSPVSFDIAVKDALLKPRGLFGGDSYDFPIDFNQMPTAGTLHLDSRGLRLSLQLGWVCHVQSVLDFEMFRLAFVLWGNSPCMWPPWDSVLLVLFSS